MIKLRAQFNYDVDEASVEAGLECKDVSLAQQSEAEEADINFIVDRYTRTGYLPQPGRVPQYGDFTGVKDYRSALDAVKAAEEAFMQLDAKIRSRFNNDPAAFLEFVDNATAEQFEEYGLAEPRAAAVVEAAASRGARDDSPQPAPGPA